jgi:hypothetical protein
MIKKHTGKMKMYKCCQNVFISPTNNEIEILISRKFLGFGGRI